MAAAGGGRSIHRRLALALAHWLREGAHDVETAENGTHGLIRACRARWAFSICPSSPQSAVGQSNTLRLAELLQVCKSIGLNEPGGVAISSTESECGVGGYFVLTVHTAQYFSP